MPSRFVRPDTTVLKISRGDTLTVKRRLTHGETIASYARMYLASADGQRAVNPLQVGMAIVTSYLIDWSLTTDDGARVTIRDVSVEALEAILNSLEPESFTEIREAIQAHDAAMQAEREAEKNGRGTETGSPEISPSPSVVTGPTSGYAISTPTSTPFSSTN